MAIATINPATGEVIRTFQPLSDAEIDKKVQRAVEIFRQERKTPYAVRAQRMLKAAEILERDKEKFAHLMTLEMGKTYKSAVAEAVKCTTACRYYAENTERFLADGRLLWVALLAMAYGAQLTVGHFQVQMWTGVLVVLTGLGHR